MRTPSHLSQRIPVKIHGFVKRFIMPPNFGPPPAPLWSDKLACYFSIRSGPSAGFLSPPAPRGSTGSELLFRVRFNPPMLSGPAHAGPFLLAVLIYLPCRKWIEAVRSVERRQRGTD